MVNTQKTTKTSQSELIEDANLTDREKFKIWLKTLLSSNKIFPEIIKTIDKIIQLQATTVSFMTDIYNSSNSTLSQAEKIIDMAERKKTILNIYLMTQNLMADLTGEESEFVTKKYIEKYTVEELAKDYDVSERTIYRKANSTLDAIYKSCQRKNITLRLILSQVKGEGWLQEIYNRNVREFLRTEKER